MQLTAYALASALEDLIAVSGIFDPADVWVGLYQTVQPNGVNTTLANIMAATGNLSALVQVTEWSPVYVEKSGPEVCDAQVMRFSPASSADAQTIAGVYLMSAETGGNLLGYIPLPAAVDLLGPESMLSFVLRLTLDPTGQWDASVSWDD